MSFARNGAWTTEQHLAAMLKRAKSRSEDKFSIRGVKKTGKHAPKPVTLPTLKFMERP